MSDPVRLPAILKTEWQRVLLADHPRRLDLLGLKADWPCREILVAVHRNTPFEFIAQIMGPFLAYGDLAARFSFGDYDDSLAVPSELAPADLHLVWLDFDRYKAQTNLAHWLAGRIGVLRGRTSAPILVADSPTDPAFNAQLAECLSPIAGVRLYPRSAVAGRLGAGFRDERLKGVGATTLSAQAGLETARELGLCWLPAAVRPRLKCIAVDLDNTLYDGVLGEDGIDGLRLGPAHLALQQRLVELQGEGLLLAVISRNEPDDVQALLAARADFALRPHHLSAQAIGWGPKSQGLADIAASLRIGVDAILLVDDNPGEIAEAASAHPMLWTLHAADPALALAGLRLGPGLLAWSADQAAAIRAEDLAAAQIRRSHGDSTTYLASLETRLDFHVNALDHLGRMFDLSNKTNQFNLALQRLSEADLARRLAVGGPRAVTISLSDALSDSGIVAMILFSPGEDRLVVDELCISCRALGRGLEDVMIGTAITWAQQQSGLSQVAFAHDTGPRNAPARQWLGNILKAPLNETRGFYTMAWPPAGWSDRLAGIPVTIRGLG
jgi:FkbH-like protein